MRRHTTHTFREFRIAAPLAVGLAFGQLGCKGPLDDELPVVDGLVPSVGQPVGTADTTAPPAQIDPATAAGGTQPQPSSGGSLPDWATQPTRSLDTPTASLGTPPPVSAPEPVIPTSPYLVQKGDSLSVIASKHNTSVSTLQKINGISGTFIRYGQTIKVPAAATAPAVAPTTPTLGTSGDSALPPPTTPEVPSLPPAPAGDTGLGSGLGFGGSSTPRPRTPSTTQDDFLNLPTPD